MTASVLVSPGNGSLVVSVTTANVGRADAPASTSRLYLSAARRRTSGAARIGKTLRVPALAPGRRARGSLSLDRSALEALRARSALPPTVYVVACADDLQRVREARSNNNCASSSTAIRLATPPPPPFLPPPATAPGQPRNVHVVSVGGASATIAWDPPVGGGAVDHYEVAVNGAPVTTTATTGVVLTGLETACILGTPAVVGVASVAASGGRSDSVTTTVMPLCGGGGGGAAASPPAAPSGLVATPGNAQAALAWTAPSSDGGSAITGYRVTPYLGGVAQAPLPTGSSATAYTVGGLVNGSAYTFTVAAINAVGTGPESPVSAAVTPVAGLPGPPTGLSGTAGNASVALVWSAPTGNGGGAITGYRVTPYLGGAAQPAQLTGSIATTYTVGGLVNGSAYTFSVAALNSAGAGPESLPFGPVTPTALVGWPEFGGSGSHLGVNANETAITTANVASLHQHWQVILPAYADGAPTVAVSVQTASGTQDLVVVTTTTGDLVARNLETGAAVWSVSFGPGSCTINNGAPVCYTTSSPVIDRAAGYVYTYGLDGKVHKVTLGTGVEVRDSTWPVVATLKPWDEKGSSALASATAANGHTYLYVTNSGYPGDRGDYQGHLTAIDLSTGVSNVFNTLCSSQAVHFVPSPGTPDCGQVQSGVWARSAVTYSPATDLIYLSTGNAQYNPVAGDWGDSVLALHADGTGANGGPVDSFTPTNYQSLDQNDLDLGSTLPALVEAPAGSTVAHLGVQGGKEGILQLLNMADLSGQHGPGHTGTPLASVAGPGGGILTAPVVRVDGSGKPWVFVSTGSNIAAYQVALDATNQPQLIAKWRLGVGATSMTLANGMLFAARSGTLSAYDPQSGASLWSTSVGSIHWQSPVVVDGLVLLEDSSGHLTAWGP